MLYLSFAQCLHAVHYFYMLIINVVVNVHPADLDEPHTQDPSM